ncbi:hypothetical protein ACFLWY_04105 [Chloroflexota bacterium]
MFGIDNLGCMLAAPANHAQGMAGVLLDVHQFAVLKAYFHPATGGTDATDAFLPLRLWFCCLDLRFRLDHITTPISILLSSRCCIFFLSVNAAAPDLKPVYGYRTGLSSAAGLHTRSNCTIIETDAVAHRAAKGGSVDTRYYGG